MWKEVEETDEERGSDAAKKKTHTMIQIGGLSTFSPLAARRRRSFFKGANVIW